jgi:uncharacterized membrane protein (Fun14 family)
VPLAAPPFSILNRTGLFRVVIKNFRAGASIERKNMAALIIIATTFISGFGCGFGLRAYLSYRRRH